MEKFQGSFRFITQKNLNWSEVDFLYTKGWVSFLEVLDYAAWKFKSTISPFIQDKIVDLLIVPLNEAKEIWNKFFSTLEREEFSVDKMLINIFSWLSEEELEKEKLLDIIEDIYCELDHLDELEMFIRYMPENNRYRGSITTSLQLKERISHYLAIKHEQSKLSVRFSEIDWI
jgi:hypothetical protein